MLTRKMMSRFLVVVLALFVTAGMASAAPFTLPGNFLNVGVDDSGGLIDSVNWVGIQFDPLGGSNYGAIDFLTPGTPFEFYSIAISGAEQGAAGYWTGNTFGATTWNTSAGTQKAALSFFSVGPVTVETQLLYFDQLTDKSINFSVTFINKGTSPITMAYARGLDPDQDVNTFGSFNTNNFIAGNKVWAVGPLTGYKIEIEDITNPYVAIGVPSVDMYWNTGLYTVPFGSALLTPHNDGNLDYTINMAWEFTLLPNVSKEIDFKYNISTVVPEPGTLLLLGAGFMGLAFVSRRLRKH